MATVAPLSGLLDDPLRLREMLGRAASLASAHRLPSVVVGMAGREGDLLFPEVVAFFASALRMDDTILRLTRERVVLMLTDVDREGAERIVRRLLAEFRERFATLEDPPIALGYFEVAPGTGPLTVKQVLPTVFGVARSDEGEADA
jgi:GGDEF domain-containing protein